MKLKESYIGAYLLIIFGLLLFARVIADIDVPILMPYEGIISGPAILLSALAYRLAKQRKVYISSPTKFRVVVEFSLIILSIYWGSKSGVAGLITNSPVLAFVWIGSLTSYFFMVFGNHESDRNNCKNDNASIESDNTSKNIDVKSNVRKTEFFGSNVAIGLGILYFLSGVNVVAQKTDGSTNGLVFGLVVILGALAYKSAKKRKLRLKPNSLIRISLEIIAIILILASVLMANTDIKRFIAEDPVPFLIWVWSLTAYLYIVASSYIKKQSD